MKRLSYLVAAEVIVALHLTWLLGALAGTFWMFHRPGYAWVQLGVAGLTCFHGLTARVCVATRFEQWLRRQSVPLAERHQAIRSRYVAIVAPVLHPLGIRARLAVPIFTGISVLMALAVLFHSGRLP